jgi:uncharacterized protein YnzC (UPF0291/DUF896 family)
MVIYDEKEQDKLIEEYRRKIRDAFKTYNEHIEEIYSYGVDMARLKECFINECTVLLTSEGKIKQSVI